MAGLPTSSSRCALFGALVLCLASCEERSLLPGDEGIDFGDGDGDPGDEDPGDGDGELGDGDMGDGDGDGTIDCAPIVSGNLVITDDTPPESIACVERVLGDLTIGPTTQLINLSALSSLQEVGGTAYIVGNLSLITVSGLEALEQVEWLHIRRNRNLSDLHGLGGLTAVDRITIINNDGLTSLAGLPDGIAPSKLEVADNQLLASLDGLPSFTALPTGTTLHVEVGENPSLIDLGGLSDCCADQALALTLEDNAKLPDLHGLESFARLDSLTLHDNAALASLDGLDNLVEVRTLDIAYDHCSANYDAALTSLLGAPNLAEVDVLQVEWVKSLTSLDGLAGVNDLTELLVRNNAALPWDDVLEVATLTGPLVLDICGGIDGPACPPEPCPMF